jgi:hypothetical protein
MTADPLAAVAEATEARRLSAAVYAHDDGRWRETIRAAVEHGASYGEVVPVAGVTRARVQQIVARRR